MVVCKDENPEWLEWIAPERFNDPDLFRIVVFYVFHSPCDGLSARGKSLRKYGWSDPWKKPYCLNEQLKQASTNCKLIFSAKKLDQMDAKLREAFLYDGFPSDLATERICVHDGKKNQAMSVFYHIRNALAHCRLNMQEVDGECVFIMEDLGGRKKDEVSARMILRKSTLLKWIDIIEAGEREYKKPECLNNVKNENQKTA